VTVVASVGLGLGAAVNLERKAAEDAAAVAASKHAPPQPGAIRQFVMDAEQDSYAGQCVDAIKQGAVDEAGAFMAKTLVAAAGKAGIPIPREEAVEKAYPFGGVIIGSTNLEAELKEYEAAGKWYEATFIKAKLVALELEMALPGLAGASAGLTVKGTDCLKMGFDFLGDKGQQIGKYLRAEYDRQQAAKQQEANALEAAKQAEQARRAEQARQAEKAKQAEQARRQAEKAKQAEQARRQAEKAKQAEQAKQAEKQRAKQQQQQEQQQQQQQQQEQQQQEQQQQEQQQQEQQQGLGNSQQQPGSGNGGYRLPCLGPNGEQWEIHPNGECGP
jgi:chemotaxis protein histidine kinase CheA